MDFDPVMYKLKVNFCSAGDFEKLPGVGKYWVERLLRLREGNGNITPQSFYELGLRYKIQRYVTPMLTSIFRR